MKIPNHESAVVDRRKVVEYLLNAAHPENGGKAAFFASLDFTVADVEDPIFALRTLASGEVAIHSASQHGDKYVIDGALTSRSGKSGAIRTIWITDRDGRVPRLVTAYPRG
jgi:hypothetical protein